MKSSSTKCCSIRFAGENEKINVPFDVFENYETKFNGNAWRMQVWTVVFLATLAVGSNCSGVEIWKNWFIDKQNAATKKDFLASFRKRLISENFDDAVIFDLVRPMTLNEFQEHLKTIEQFNKLCKE